MTLTVEEVKYMEAVIHCLPRIVKELSELNKALKALLEAYREAHGLKALREVAQDRPPP